MAGQGPTRRSTTLKSSSSVMRKTGETLMRRELRATRIPSQLLERNLKQMAKRALPLALSRPLPRRPGQRTLGLQRRNQHLLPQSLPHLHLTGVLSGTGDPRGTTQIVGVLPASPQHPKTRTRHGGNVGSNLPQRFLWQWSGHEGGGKRRSDACRRSAGQPAPRNSSGLMKSLGRRTSDSRRSRPPHLLPLLPLLCHLRSLRNFLQLQLCHQHQPRHQRKNPKSQHKPLLHSPPPAQEWPQLPLWRAVVALPVAPAVAASRPAQWNLNCLPKRVLTHRKRFLHPPHPQPQRWSPRAMESVLLGSLPARAWATPSTRSHCRLASSGSSRSSS